MQELNTIRDLLEKYGNKSLKEIEKELKCNNTFECPECKGLGYINFEYNGYPDGLPDSGWVYEAKYKRKKCELCNGLGYTEYEFEPHYIQDGWQIKNKDTLIQESNDKIENINENPDYYGPHSSKLLIEEEKRKIELFNKIYPIVKRKE